MTQILERIRASITKGFYKDTLELIPLAFDQGLSAEDILDDGFLPAMNTVEQLYNDNAIGIPNILASVRCLKKGLELLTPHFQISEYAPPVKVLIGTATGDLHDLGKNLVSIMLEAQGFQVIDLGVDVSGKQFVAALKEHPDVSLVCISALLTTTVKEVQHAVKAIHRYDTKGRIKIMVGGAPITQEFADLIGADGYTDNAVDAAHFAKQLMTKPKI